MSNGFATYSMILCSLFQRELVQRGLRQQDFFNATGISTGTWSRLNRGQAHFQLEDLRAAARFFGKNVSVFTTQADEIEKKLKEEEDIEFIGKTSKSSSHQSTHKSNTANGVGTFIAVAALAFLLNKATKD